MLTSIMALCGLLAAAPATRAPGDLEPVVVEAIRLYDQGNYEDAKRSLQGLDAAGVADGPLLYRLFFCERATGDEAAARAVLERAAAKLEDELGTSRTLDTSFYLANAYSNLGRTAESQNVARSAIEQIEKKKLAMPDTPIGHFQLGKLYQDAGRAADASTQYAKALAGFDLKEGRYAGNARWALRFIGTTAAGRGAFEESESAFARLIGIGGASPSDWSALAVARVRMGRYGDAAEAWKSGVRLDPAGGDDARYGARFAEVAASIGPLPTADSAGTPFASMPQAALEAAMKDRAAEARTLHARAAESLSGGKLDAALRAELTEKLLQARRLFVAAGLEYAVRRLPIRETAFRDGYAVLVFQDSEWSLPPEAEAEAS
jgi:tetratricopeptide (TPR) repeat protein